MGQQLMLRINQATTFDEVHQWISNHFNSTYAGVDEDKGTIWNINDADEEQYDEWKDYNEETEEYDYEYNDDDVKYAVAMLNKGKGKRFRKGKGKGGKDKGGKDSKSVTCHACGQQGRVSPNCPMKKGGKAAKATKDRRDKDLAMVNGMMESYQQPPSHGYQQNGYSGYNGQPLNPGQAPANGCSTKEKDYGKPPWHNFGKGKKGQLPIANIADYHTQDHTAYRETQDWSYNQDWESWNNYPTKEYPQYPEPIQQIMQQPPYNGHPDVNKIHLGSQLPRHLRDFGC
eukprot:3262660-Amphidinium_carterae.1